MNKHAIKWQNFARVGLQLKFALRIWPYGSWNYFWHHHLINLPSLYVYVYLEG